MKNKGIMVILAVIMVISLSCCGEKSADESFLTDMAEGLQARWDLSESQDSEALNAEDFEACVDVELDLLSKYKEAEFEDEKLGELALKYIEGLEKAKDLTKYYDKNYAQFYTEYSPISDERSQIINIINSEYGLDIEEKYQKTLDGFIAQAELVDSVQEIMEKVKFEKVKDEYGWKTYEATVENTSENTFRELWFNVSLEDSDGVVVETVEAHTSEWAPGQKHKFQFQTDKKFDKANVVNMEYSGYY